MYSVLSIEKLVKILAHGSCGMMWHVMGECWVSTILCGEGSRRQDSNPMHLGPPTEHRFSECGQIWLSRGNRSQILPLFSFFYLCRVIKNPNTLRVQPFGSTTLGNPSCSYTPKEELWRGPKGTIHNTTECFPFQSFSGHVLASFCSLLGFVHMPCVCVFVCAKWIHVSQRRNLYSIFSSLSLSFLSTLYYLTQIN